jgi:hypothetical protein
MEPMPDQLVVVDQEHRLTHALARVTLLISA